MAVAGLTLALGGWSTGAIALQCPVSHPTVTEHALKEDKQEIASLSSTFRHDGGAALSHTVATLRHLHPSASNGEIINYLVTAYCPVVDSRAGMSERQKRDAMRRFSQTARGVVYK